MPRIGLRFVVTSLLAAAFSLPAFGYNLVNTSWTVVCLFSPTCSVTVTDHLSPFTISGGSGNGLLQSRIFQGQAGTPGSQKWVYEYRINLTNVHGYTYPPYVDQLAISDWGYVPQFDYNSDGLATDEVFVITSGGAGTKAPNAAFLSAPWSFFTFNDPVYVGSSSYFFGLTSERPPVIRTMWVKTDTGWVAVNGYAPQLP